jgi:hypothetical protein
MKLLSERLELIFETIWTIVQKCSTRNWFLSIFVELLYMKFGFEQFCRAAPHKIGF